MPFTKEALFINTLASDVEVLRLVVTGILVRLIEAQPQALDDLKNGVLTGLSQAGPDTPQSQDNERVRQLTYERGQAFFQDLEYILKLPQTKPKPSDVN